MVLSYNDKERKSTLFEIELLLLIQILREHSNKYFQKESQELTDALDTLRLTIQPCLPKSLVKA